MNRRCMELLQAENFPDYCHIEFKQQRQQGHLLACCDDLAHDGYIDGGQEECRFVAEVRRSTEGYTLSPLDENRQAGLVRSGIARSRRGSSVERKTWYGGCVFSCRLYMSNNLAGQFSPHLNYSWRSVYARNLMFAHLAHSLLLSRILPLKPPPPVHKMLCSDRNRQ